MNSRQAGSYWDRNADAWTKLSRAGYDLYRDSFNTPAFLDSLPDVTRLAGLDVGCGEGHNTRLVARAGARMAGLDISPTFIRHAQAEEARAPLGIDYIVGDACDLPFEAEQFDFVVAFMSLMDIPEPGKALCEMRRVLRPGGFVQFSICHPCFDTPHRRNLRDAAGITYAIEVGQYFERLDGRVSRWLFSSVPEDVAQGLPRFEVPRFTRTLSDWLNLLTEAGFNLERAFEPRPSDDVVQDVPAVQDAQVVAYFLHLRGRAGVRP